MSIFSLNRATLIGNVTRDPDLTYTAKGTPLLRFSIATNRSLKNEDGSFTDIPTYHNIVAWSRTAERLAKILKKGSKVYIEGRIDNRSYEKDGQTKYISEVIADNAILFDKGRPSSNTNKGAEEVPPPPDEGYKTTPSKKTTKKQTSSDTPPTDIPTGTEDIDENDIPF